MVDTESFGYQIIFGIGLIMGLVVGGILVGSLVDSSWRGEVIKRGFGEYHPQTSFFRWKREVGQ